MKMEIIVGTYEELILSYKLTQNDQKYTFAQSFTDHSHIGNVKTVTVSKKGVLASGSSDETIRLFNIITRKEIGCLMHHEGSITCLMFFGKKNFFSTSEDGTIGVWQVGRWECLRTLKGHKDAVNSISIHPTGKMALSVSRDKTLRTWNLITAKCAFVSNIKTEADTVTWSPTGDYYLLGINNKVDVYKSETSVISKTITVPSRIYVVKFIKDNIVVLAGEGGKVHIYDITTGTKLHEFSTETNRVKGLEVLQDENTYWFITGSSDGLIKAWKVNTTKWTSKLVAEQNTKFRITCLAACKLPSSGGQRKSEAAAKEEEGEEVEEEQDSEEEKEDSEEEQAEVKPKKANIKKKEGAKKKDGKQKRKAKTEEKTEASPPSKKSKKIKLKKKKKLMQSDL